MTSVVLDSSVIVAAFKKEEPRSQEAFRLLTRIERGEITLIVPVTVVLETVAAIRRRTGDKTLALNIGERILSFPRLSLIDCTVFRMSESLDIVAESGLRGMDVIVVGVAREFDVPLITLDREMAQLAIFSAEVISLGDL